MTLVIPCYNEADRLDLQAFADFGAAHPDVRLLFVDDGSSDATFAVASGLCDRLPNAEVLRLPVNAGKAEAVRRGVRHALEVSPKYVGFWDADLATPLGAALDFRALLDEREDLDMVFGARVQLLGRTIVRNPARHYAGRVFATVVSTMLGLAVYDTQCGAKLFRVTDTLPELFAAPFVTRWIFDVEIIARARIAAKRNGTDALALYEFPLTEWRDVPGSRLNPRDLVRVPLELTRIYDAYLRNI